MAGEDAPEAVENFVHPLRQVADLITESVLFPSGRHVLGPDEEPHALAFADAPATKLRGTDVTLDFRHSFRVVRTDDRERGPYKAQTAQYLYAFVDSDGRDLMAFHWHPLSRSTETDPHLHLYRHTAPFDVSDLHLPTGRISFEYVVRLAIEKFGATPNPPDREVWDRILTEHEETFRRFQTWPGRG